MEKLIARVMNLLSDRFKGSKIELDLLSSGTKITGVLIWKGFSRYDEMERQELMWKLFEKALTQDERRKISLIVAATPAEAVVFQEN